MKNRAPERTERPQRTPAVPTLSAAFVADCRADWRLDDIRSALDTCAQLVWGRPIYEVSILTADEWNTRGEECPAPVGGFVLLHDGGDLSLYTGDPGLRRAVRDSLSRMGLRMDGLTGWATALAPANSLN